MAIRVYACGYNSFGNLGNNSTVQTSSPIIMSTTGWYQMPVGSSTMAAIGIDRNVYTWGSGNSGALGNGTANISVSSPIQITSDGTWSMVGGGYFFVALKNDGTIWSWGNGSQGGIGNSLKINISSMIQIGTENNWTFVTANQQAGCAFGIKTDGSLWSWGSNLSGQQGRNTTVSVSSPVQVGTASNWSQIACGQSSFAIKTDGTLWATGDGTSGNNGLNRVTAVSSWTQVGAGTDWAYCCSQSNNMALKKNGTLWVWGLNSVGNLGDGTVINKSSPIQIAGSWTMATAQGDGYKGVKTDGTLWSWGASTYGQIADGFAVNRSSPVQILIGSGPFTNLGYNTQQLWVQADGPSPTPSSTPSPTPSTTPSPTPSTTPSPTNSNYTLYGWGSNSIYGAVGNNSAANVSSPVMVMSSVDLFCTNGGSQNAALKSGNLYIWGRNTSGQLGLNSTINVSSPTMVGTANNWVFVNPGFNTGAIKSDGTLWMCGDNGSGSVGDGTVISRSSFVQIAGTWSKVRTETFFAPYHTVAIRSNGTLWGWGDNSIGQLGQNNLVNYSSPVQIGTANNYIDCAVACVGVAPPYNTNLTVALRSDGTLWVIGNGSYEGRTGTGVLTNYSSITQVGTSTDWASISCTTNFVAAVKKDSTLWTWGTGGNGALGTGNVISRSSPTQIGTGTDWAQAQANYYEGFARKTNGTIWSWGFFANGVLGNGMVSRSSPVQIGPSSNAWVQIGGGYYNSFGIRLPDQTATPSPTASVTPSPTPTMSPTPSGTTSPTPTLSPTATPSPTPSPSESPSPTPSPSESPSPTPSPSPSHSPSPTPSPSHSPSPSPTPSPSNSPSPTPSPSPSPSPSPTATPFPSQSPFPTFTPQPTQSPQPTFTPQPTVSPVPTVTPLPTFTAQPTPTNSPTPFPTFTPQPTFTPVATVTPFPTLTPLPTFTPFPTLTPQATPVYPTTNNYILVPYQNNMNVTNIVPSQEGYAFNNGGGAGINLLLQFMQNDPTPQQVYIELTNNSSVDMVITIGSLVYVIEPGTYFNTTALMPFGQKVTVQSSASATFTPSSVYGQIFILPTPTPTPAEILKLQRNIIAVEGDAGSVDTGLINGTSVQRTGYITITENLTQVKVMEIPDGGLIDKTIQQIPDVIPLVCSGYLWVGEL